MTNVTADIITLDSGKSGPTLAIFAGVHGNELAGVYALQELLPMLTPTKGKLYVAFANPTAIKANVRMINKNLNRCFMPDNTGSLAEDQRARQLMKVLDTCDALLDLHMFYDDEGLPFVICEEESIDIAQKFDVSIISTGWATTEPGASDGYMHSMGKIGLCVECGPISKAKEYTDFAKNTIWQFLQHFDMSPQTASYSDASQRIITTKGAVFKSSAKFILREGYKNFDTLKPGQVIAVEGNKQYIAGQDECIILPHYNARVGEEAYIIGSTRPMLNLNI